ncbi:MAG: nucleoside diphosphate kinase regulator [Alphaproteobacteria bacterium]|nr:nucleoside diphosphate kinase regulator [Alphaproteobacteria bacterium]MCB9686064.1 nucleoside diphosphate kinase regulator [Alphaproteobacteria bacterium]
MNATLPEIIVTESDHERLTAILRGLPAQHAVAVLLRRELDRAEIVESMEVPGDVVTMNSQVVLEDPETGQRHHVTLVYPSAANFDVGRLSILAPVGAALLGLRPGQTIDWPLPSGRVRTIRVVSVDWQPEAAGELDL